VRDRRVVSTRARSAASVTLAIVGVLLCIVSVVAVWSRNQVLDTDRYLKSVVPLASDPVIQDEVAAKVATAINDHLDAESLAKEALPPRAQVLAPALAGAAEAFVTRTTSTFVHSDAFVELWTQLNRVGHDELVTLLTGDKSDITQISDGELRLDLGQVVEAVKARLAAAGLTVVSRIPPITLVVDVADAKGVQKARTYVKILDQVATWLPILAILLLGAAVALARRRPRMAYVVCAGVLTAMLLTRGLVYLGAHVAANNVPPETASAAAVHAYYTHLTSLLQHGAVLVGLIFGLVGIAAVAGPLAVRLGGGTHPSEVDGPTWWVLGTRLAVLVVLALLLVTAPPLAVTILVGIALVALVVVVRRRYVAPPPAPPAAAPA
jgi:hypothetical protein